jgi:5'-nucleotidase
MDRPLTVRTAPNGFRFVNGTPTDCVHLAVTGLLDALPDMVISGINFGPNMGDDTIYSGTVAAATEGYLLGIPSLAISLASKVGRHFDTAARVTLEMVERLQRVPLSGPVLLNLNIPDVAYKDLGELEITRLGKRHKAEPVVKEISPRKETVYWVGPAGGAQDAGPGTDFYAVAAQRISVTPLQVDLTHVSQIPLLRDWLNR